MKIKLVNFIVLIEDNKKISVLVYQNNQTICLFVAGIVQIKPVVKLQSNSGIGVKEHMVWFLVTDGLIILGHFVLGAWIIHQTADYSNLETRFLEP